MTNPPGDPVAYANKDLPKQYSPSRTYYDCEICGAMHPIEWNGDCRQDNASFNMEELDKHHGGCGKWTAVPMSDVTGQDTK